MGGLGGVKGSYDCITWLVRHQKVPGVRQVAMVAMDGVQNGLRRSVPAASQARKPCRRTLKVKDP